MWQVWTAGVAVAAVLAVPCAGAQTPERGAAEAVADTAPAWRVQITPYVWGTGLHGTAQAYAGGPTGHVNESLSDVLSQLDAAFFLNAVVRRGPWAGHLDVTRAALSQSAMLDVAPGVRLLGQAKVRQTAWGLLGGYHWQASPRSSWDWLAGLRYWDIRLDLQASLPGYGTRALQVDRSWVYPVAAARWHYQWSPRWSSLTYLDVGSDGRAGNRTWQGVMTANYALREQWYLSLGYRVLSVRFQQHGADLDLRQHGPLLGVTYRF